MDLSRAQATVAAVTAVFLALMGPAPGPAAAGTTITDPLTAGSTVATRRNGGEFTVEGWKVTTNSAHKQVGQYLYYLLPEGVTGGTLTFEAKGFKFDKYPSRGGETEEREHILGVWDEDEKHDKTSDAIGFLLRLYDHKNNPGTFYAGSHRLRFDSPTFEKDCNQKAPVAWSSTAWYKFRVEWSPTFVRWFKNDVQQCSVSLLPVKNRPGAPKVPLRHLYVGSDYRALYLTPVNVTYRNVSIVVN
jgi:hypothetical protein